MRRFIDGVETVLEPTGRAVKRSGDRLVIDGVGSAAVERKGDTTLVSFRGAQYRIETKRARSGSGATSSGELRAMMPGAITDVRVAEGDAVEAGQTLVVLEAMKTQQPIEAPFKGRVKTLPVKIGDQVTDGQVLAIVEAT